MNALDTISEETGKKSNLAKYLKLKLSILNLWKIIQHGIVIMSTSSSLSQDTGSSTTNQYRLI